MPAEPQEWTQQQPGRGEVVSVALVHHFHAEAGTVQHIRPGVQDAALTIKDGLVEVEAVQVEGHG